MSSINIKTTGGNDSIPPIINNIYADKNGWINEDTFVISCTITDNSNISSTNLRFNNKDYTPYHVDGYSYSWRVPTPTVFGYYDMDISARDSYDNVGYGSGRVRMGYDVVSPTINTTDISFQGGVRVGATASDSSSGIDCIYYKISAPNSSTSFGSPVGIEGNSSYHTFTVDKDGNEFKLGSIYYVEIIAKDVANNYSSKKIVSVQATTSRPEIWNWSVAEKDAFLNGGRIATLTWQRWNAFLDNIKGTASWYHDSIEDIYNVESAKMTSSSKTLTAMRFNTVKNAIGSMNSTGISNVSKGDIVKGEYFITLSLKLAQITKSTSLGTISNLYNMDLLHMLGEIEDGNRSKNTLRSNIR